MAVVIRPFGQRRMRKAHARCAESAMRYKLRGERGVEPVTCPSRVASYDC